MNPFLSLAILLPLTPAPQPPQRIDLGSVTATESVLKLAPRPRRSFEPLVLRDKGRLLPESELVTLPNGRKLTAGQLRQELEPLQKALNEAGYSLNDGEKEFVLREPAVSVRELNAQVAPLRTELKRGARPLSALTIVAPRAVELGEGVKLDVPSYKGLLLNLESFTGGAAPDGKILRRGPSLEPSEPLDPVSIPVDVRKNWSKSFGSKNFGAGFGADIALTGHVSGNDRNALNLRELNSDFQLAVSGRATGRVLEKEVELLAFNGSYKADKASNKATLAAGVFVGGQKVWSDDTTVSLGAKEKRTERSVQAAVRASFPILGPISITAEAGIQGKAGVIYGYDLRPSSVNGEVKPFVEASGYAQGGLAVGAGALSCGVAIRGSVTLLKYNGELGANVGVGLRGGGRVTPSEVVLFERAYWYNELELLSGRIDLVLEVPFFADPTLKLFDWGGFRTDGYLLDFQREQVIGTTKPLLTLLNPNAIYKSPILREIIK
jgi:hypothetical protein